MVSTTRPWVSSLICSGEKSLAPTARSAAPTQFNAGSSNGSVGRPSRREHCDSSSTPSPAMLNVPLFKVPRRGSLAASRRTSRTSSSCTNCSRGSYPSTVGITGIEKYSASAESAKGPRMFANRRTHTATSGRLRAKPRT